MSLQLPILTKEQQQDLLQGLQVNSLYPLTFQINRLMDAAHFPAVDTAGGGRYVQCSFILNNSIAIAGITTSVFQLGGTFYRQAVQVSLLPTMTLADQSPLTTPFDTANILDRSIFLNDSLNTHKWFLPSNYYIQSGKVIYVYFWIETAGINSGNTYVGDVTLHTIQTGVLS